MLAPPLSQDDHFTLSYIRQPVEEAEVIHGSVGRLGQPLGRSAGMASWYLTIGILGGAALSLFLNIYRSLILLPTFGTTPLIDVSNLMLICSIPCLGVYVMVSLSLRREAYHRRVSIARRVRPDAAVTVTISPEAIAWERPGAVIRLAWSEVAEIAERDGRIEFDSDATVHYIPAHAFHNKQEQAAVLGRIRTLWHQPDPAKP